MKFSKNLYICIYTHVYENCIFCIYSVYIHTIYTLSVYIIYTYRHPRLVKLHHYIDYKSQMSKPVRYNHDMATEDHQKYPSGVYTKIKL